MPISGLIDDTRGLPGRIAQFLAFAQKPQTFTFCVQPNRHRQINHDRRIELLPQFSLTRSPKEVTSD